MTATDSFKSAFPRAPRAAAAQMQDTLPGRYSRGVRGLSMLAFGYVIFAYLNESVLHWVAADVDPNLCISGFRAPLWLSHWTEYIVIVLFGIWRTLAEKNPYTRKRLGVLTAVVGVLWWLVPYYLRIIEPYIGQQPHEPIFPHLHMPGTLTFFLILLLVFLFGRRVVCGWGCPCVGIREMVGFPFRANTPRDEKSFRWRHLKWPFFALYMVIFALIVIPGAPDVSLLCKVFLGLIIVPYFLTMLLAPLIGNRSYCRFICPYGASSGVLNRIGFFGVDLDRNKCNDCRRCEQACDMGIPIWKQGKEHGRIISTEECMGCARCVNIRPRDGSPSRITSSEIIKAVPRRTDL